jgi:MPBQ/MSBQ methyltransferase
MGQKKNQVKGKSALRFYHEVLGLDELHAGIWEDEALNLDGLKIAQRRYSGRLVSLVPEGVRRILDVGAGTGSVSKLLAERGFEVEGLSPDPYQQQVYTENTGLPFHLNWLEKYDTSERYDLLLFSESAQYIKLDQIFENAKRLAPGGYLLVADFFVTKQEGGELSRRGHFLPDFQQAAEQYGFVEDHYEDITDPVLPTMDLAMLFVDRHVKPGIIFVNDVYGSRHPLLFRLVRWLFRRKLADWQNSLELIDSKEFARLKRYLILRYRVPAADQSS